MKLQVTRDTILKQKPVQSSELPDQQKLPIGEGELDIEKFEDVGSHLLVTFVAPMQNQAQWYVFEEHIKLLQENPHPTNSDRHESPDSLSGRIQIPGREVSLIEPIISGGSFTWAEATKNGTRIPVSKEIVENIIKMADRMQWVRECWVISRFA